jgi:hypothetical protein
VTLKQVRERARILGVKNYSRFRKDRLIRTIQETEGNAPCFKNISNCGEFCCCWREDCQIL